MATKKRKSAKRSKPAAAKPRRKAKAARPAKKKPALKPRAKAKSAAKAAPKKSAKKAPKKAARKIKIAAKPAPKAKAKPATKPAPKAKAKPAPRAPTPKPIHRRDGAGNLDPAYAADLRSRIRPREEEAPAFFDRNRPDDLAEELAEEVIGSATSGEYEAEDALNQAVPEERGGPFVPSTAGAEFAEGDDESNPKGAVREPFPRT